MDLPSGLVQRREEAQALNVVHVQVREDYVSNILFGDAFFVQTAQELLALIIDPEACALFRSPLISQSRINQSDFPWFCTFSMNYHIVIFHINRDI